ncbi:MAG: hypothetical protein IJ165_14325 [Proteobacteria bacterium]|nr:hypothetical protein [Pseudomonadota bacterium]
MQFPFRQTSLLAQIWPHLPQFSEDVLRSAQISLSGQKVSFGLQMSVHAPFWQVWSALQAMSHFPQCSMSVCRLKHDSPQADRPLGQYNSHDL